MKTRPVAALAAIVLASAGGVGGVDVGSAGGEHSPDVNARPAGSEDVTLEFWTFADFAEGPAGDVFADLIAEFEEANPGVTVEFVGKPAPEIVSGLVASVGSGEAPDVVTTQLTAGGPLVTAGALTDVGPYWGEAAETFRTQFNPAFVDVMTTDEAVWGVPFTSYATVLYRNLDVLGEAGVDTSDPPADWAEWADQIATVTEAGRYGLPDYTFGPWQFMSIYGGTPDATFALADDGTSTTLDEENLTTALAFLQSIQPSVAPIDPIDQAATDLFVTNELAFLVQGPWLDPTLREVDGLNYDAVPMPGVSADQTGGTRGGEFFAIPAGTSHPDEAWAFIEFLSDAAQTSRFAAATGRLVANDSALEDPEVASNTLVQTTATAFESAVDESPLMQDVPANFLQPLGDAVAEVGQGSLDPAEAATRIIEELNASLG
jgi:multiple sugar transport system substrate-binding protein